MHLVATLFMSIESEMFSFPVMINGFKLFLVSYSVLWHYLQYIHKFVSVHLHLDSSNFFLIKTKGTSPFALLDLTSLVDDCKSLL